MKIKVGSYEVNGEFKGKTEAKKIFLSHFPAVTEKDLDTQLDKLFKDADKSDNVEQKAERSAEADAEIGKGSTRRK